MTVACRKPRRTRSTASTTPRMPVWPSSPSIDAPMASNTCSDDAMPGNICRQAASAGNSVKKGSSEGIKPLRADRTALSPLKCYGSTNDLRCILEPKIPVLFVMFCATYFPFVLETFWMQLEWHYSRYSYYCLILKACVRFRRPARDSLSSIDFLLSVRALRGGRGGLVGHRESRQVSPRPTALCIAIVR